jgi:hypothetical protein
MSENTPKPAVKKTTARKPRATKKAAAEAPVKIENVNIGEGIIENEEGQKVIAGKKPTRKPSRSNLNSEKENSTIGSRAADAALAKTETQKETKKQPVKDDKVALWSSKNMRWTNVGALVKGYNIVTKEAAEKWLTRQGVRKASAEEVATYYGK